MTLVPYQHTVHYYETDKMGIVHHSNYSRWMEEARVDFLAQLGWPFDKLESMGLSSPVVSLTCRFLLPTHFSENIAIMVRVVNCRGVKLVLSYDMTNEIGKTVFTGTSEHCFLSLEGSPVNLKKVYPDFYTTLTNQPDN